MNRIESNRMSNNPENVWPTWRGIFGKLTPLDQILSEGNRVEIYRPALGKPPKKSRPARKPVPRRGAATVKATESTGDRSAQIAVAETRSTAATPKMAVSKRATTE